ncbi:putative glycosyl transferase [Actinobacillus equuli]|nr:putative glycosyl transferase [Actinobacillus equuli]
MKKIVLIGNVASMITNFRKELVIELVNRGYTVYCYAYGYTEKEQKKSVLGVLFLKRILSIQKE